MGLFWMIINPEIERVAKDGSSMGLSGSGMLWSCPPQLASQSGRMVAGLVGNYRKVDMGISSLLENFIPLVLVPLR